MFALVFHLESVRILPGVMLYIGPDVFLPFTSAIAALAGVVLMFWNRLINAGRKVWQMVSRPKS